MSRQAEALTWERSRAGKSELLMLVKIADLADDDGRNAWPEVPALMKYCRMSERGAQYTLRRLVETGEIEIEHNDEDREIVLRGGRKFRPKWFIHVRCVCVWEEYQHETEPAKIAGFETGRPRRKPAKIAGSAKPETRKVCVENPQSLREKPAKIVDGLSIRARAFDPLVDPAVEQVQGAAPPALPQKNADDPGRNLRVITKLAHEVLDLYEGLRDCGMAEVSESVKVRCAELAIAYWPGDVLQRAIDSAVYQRQRAGKPAVLVDSAANSAFRLHAEAH